MQRITLFLLGLVWCYTALPQKPDRRGARLDTAINRLLKEWHAAGCAIALVEKNKIVLTKGYGLANYEKRMPATDSILFAIGSANGRRVLLRLQEKNNWFSTYEYCDQTCRKKRLCAVTRAGA